MTTTPTAPIATPTKSPGYDTLIALTSLGAVALMAIRRY
jgi:hypothetical protein